MVSNNDAHLVRCGFSATLIRVAPDATPTPPDDCPP